MKLINDVIKCFRKNCKNQSIILEEANNKLLIDKNKLLCSYMNHKIDKIEYKQQLHDLYDNFYNSTKFMNATKCKLQHCNKELIKCLNFIIKNILNIPIKSTYSLTDIKLLSMKIKHKLIENDLKNI